MKNKCIIPKFCNAITIISVNCILLNDTLELMVSIIAVHFTKEKKDVYMFRIYYKPYCRSPHLRMDSNIKCKEIQSSQNDYQWCQIGNLN